MLNLYKHKSEKVLPSRIEGKTKQQLLAESIQLFAAKGYHQTSIADIAQVCGISKSTVYCHFSSKEAIIRSVLKQVHRHLYVAYCAQLKDCTCMNKEEVLDRLYSFLKFQENDAYASLLPRLFIEFSQGKGRLASIIQRYARYWQQGLSSMLAGALGESHAEGMSHIILAYCLGFPFWSSLLDKQAIWSKAALLDYHLKGVWHAA